MFDFLSNYNEVSEWVFTGIIFFLGLTLGWFFKFNGFWAIVGILLFIPVINILIQADHSFFNIPFFLGFMVHTHKKIFAFIGFRK